MGGNAIGGRRIPRSEFLDRVRKIEILANYIKRKVWFPDVIYKEDYGDVDVIVSKAGKEEFIHHFRDFFNSQRMKRNSDVVSLEWDGVQVDFIFVPRESVEFARAWYSFGDNSASMGRIFSWYGYKLSWNGLFWRGKTKNDDVLVTRDWDEALGMFQFMYPDPSMVAVNGEYANLLLLESPFISAVPFLFAKAQRESRPQQQALAKLVYDRPFGRVIGPPRKTGYQLLKLGVKWNLLKKKLTISYSPLKRLRRKCRKLMSTSIVAQTLCVTLGMPSTKQNKQPQRLGKDYVKNVTREELENKS